MSDGTHRTNEKQNSNSIWNRDIRDLFGDAFRTISETVSEDREAMLLNEIIRDIAVWHHTRFQTKPDDVERGIQGFLNGNSGALPDAIQIVDVLIRKTSPSVCERLVSILSINAGETKTVTIERRIDWSALPPDIRSRMILKNESAQAFRLIDRANPPQPAPRPKPPHPPSGNGKNPAGNEPKPSDKKKD